MAVICKEAVANSTPATFNSEYLSFLPQVIKCIAQLTDWNSLLPKACD